MTHLNFILYKNSALVKFFLPNTSYVIRFLAQRILFWIKFLKFFCFLKNQIWFGTHGFKSVDYCYYCHQSRSFYFVQQKWSRWFLLSKQSISRMVRYTAYRLFDVCVSYQIKSAKLVYALWSMVDPKYTKMMRPNTGE